MVTLKNSFFLIILKENPNIYQEIEDFLKKNPPKPKLSKKEVLQMLIFQSHVQIDGLLTENAEILLDLRREQSKKKNKNIETSNQYDLSISFIVKFVINILVTRMERNLVRICKYAPKSVYNSNQARANKNTLLKLMRKKQQNVPVDYSGR